LLLPNRGEPELYDLVSDPGEKNNIASEYPEVVARLKKAVQDWEATVADPDQYGLSSP